MHIIQSNVQTGEVTQIEYTPEEQTIYDAMIATQEEANQKSENTTSTATA